LPKEKDRVVCGAEKWGMASCMHRRCDHTEEDGMKKECSHLFLVVSILCLCASIAHAQSSTNYRIRIDVLAGGGGPEGSANYDLDSALGQSSAIGISSSTHYINHAGFWSAIPEPEPYIPVYVSLSPGCSGKVPCYNVLQTGIDSAESFTVINVTEETYAEDIVFNSPKFLSLRGGWDLTFTNSSSYTVIQGSLTISSGKLIVEYIILR
jgi:hypothetical protein